MFSPLSIGLVALLLLLLLVGIVVEVFLILLPASTCTLGKHP